MEPARAGFHKIVVDILRRAPVEDAALIAWRLICGNTVDARTTALDFKNGVLRVKVPDSTWRANLEEFTPQYLESLNRMLTDKFERIVFVTERAESKKVK
jgi:hypothetical protein